MKKPSLLFLALLVVVTTALPSDELPLATGIWTSQEEISRIPPQGPAWDVVYLAARKDISNPNLADQDDHTGVFLLAKAIVYASTGMESYKREVITSIERLVTKGFPGGRTLAWARNICGYVLAADLIGYRSGEFDDYLAKLAHEWECTQVGSPYRPGRYATLREMFDKRPNNWGAFAFASLSSIYRYLGDYKNLADIRSYFIRAVEGPTPPALDFRTRYTPTWQADDNQPRWINPKNSLKCGINISDLLPEEMVRGGEFSCDRDEKDFTFTGYAWEGLQGLIVAARILDRANMPIWSAGDSALYRAAFALQQRLASFNPLWKARDSNDGWLLAFLDDAYGSQWAAGLNGNLRVKWGFGRGAGFGFILNRPDAQTYYYTLSGSVTHAATGGAISGAIIKLIDGETTVQAAQSDSLGRYQLEVDRAGRFEIVCTKERFEPWSRFSVIAGLNQQKYQEISLTPKHEAGLVTSFTGQAKKDRFISVPVRMKEDGNYFVLAFVSTSPFARSQDCRGLGLNWQKIASQCAGRNTRGIEVWTATATASLDGIVEITTGETFEKSVSTVCVYAGVDLAAPIQQVITLNTNGYSGSCENGQDSDVIPLQLEPVSDSNRFVFALAAPPLAAMYNGHPTLRTIPPEEPAIDEFEITVFDGTLSDFYFTNPLLLSEKSDWGAVLVELKHATELAKGRFDLSSQTHNEMSSPPFILVASYPNPFNASTRIGYHLLRREHVRLRVYDITGRSFSTLVNGDQDAGFYNYMWKPVNDQGDALPSGVYFYRLEAGRNRQVGKMVYVR